jgi:hypothetical protein
MSRPLYEHTQTGWPIRIAFLTLASGLLVGSDEPRRLQAALQRAAARA